jgi:hypothetical protein
MALRPPNVGRALVLAAALAALGTAAPAWGTITAAPDPATIFPSQTTGPITVNLTFPPASGSGFGSLNITGGPPGASIVPATPIFNISAGALSSTTTFQIATNASIAPGTYTFNISVLPSNLPPNVQAGTGTMRLTVLQPSFNPGLSANLVTLTRGGAAQAVNVSSTPVDPGFLGGITYSFSGFPTFITTGGAQFVASPFAPATFPFQASANATPGTYSGLLIGAPSAGLQKTLPITVNVVVPDIGASFSSPSVSVCNGGVGAQNSLVLTPLNGYTGTPSLFLTSVPQGVTVTPANPTSGPLPPTQFIPFAITASGFTGTRTVTVNVSDKAAGISKDVSFTVTSLDPNYAPSVTPASLPLTSGGPAGALTANLQPLACYATDAVVSFGGAPTGVTVTPGAGTISAPGFAPVAFSVTAALTVRTGTYPLTFTYTPRSGPVKTVVVTLAITNPQDFLLSISPIALSLPAGSQGSVSVSAVGIAGFSGPVSVTSPSQPGVTFSPASFILAPGGAAQVVGVAVSPAAQVGTFNEVFTGAATGIPGAHSVQFQLTVRPPPDFAISANPVNVTIFRGGTGIVNLSAVGLNGFNQSIQVAAPTIQDMTFTPAFLNLQPSGNAAVQIAVSFGAPLGITVATFVGTSQAVAGPRTATVNINVTDPPDFSLSASPTTLAIQTGGSGTVMISASGVNGFNLPVTVTTPNLPGVTFTPATFTLTAGGAAQTMTVAVDRNAAPGTLTATIVGSVAGVPNGRDSRAPRSLAHSVALTLNITLAPDFSLLVNPPALSIFSGDQGSVQVSASGINGFNGPVSVSVGPAPGVTFTPAAFTLTPGGPAQAVTVAAGPGVNLSQPVVFTGQAVGVTGVRSALLQLAVTTRPDYLLSVNPPALTLKAGQSGVVNVAVTGLGNFDLTVGVLMPTLANVTFTPSQFRLSPGGAQSVSVTAGPNPPAGTVSGNVRGAVSDETPKLVPFSVTILGPPPVIRTITPPTFRAGEGITAITIDGANFLPGAAVTSPASDLTIGAATVVNAGQIRVDVSAPGTATPGPRTLIVRNPDGQQSNPGTLGALPPRPIPRITGISPPALATGAVSVVLTITGVNFATGAVIRSATAGVTVVTAEVLSPTLAKATVSVRSDATPGGYRLDLTNPDGASAPGGGTVIVTAHDGIGAPLSVTSAVIVFPRPGTLIEPDKPVFPRAVLATTGLGTIIGFWRYDGFPFDQVVVVASSSGYPVEVASKIPIPVSFVGGHTIDLQIESPQAIVTPVVPIIQSVESLTGLRLLGPPDGAIVSRAMPALRWTLVPGTSGYEVQVVKPDKTERTFRISTDQWVPSARDLAELGPGVHYWRVRAVFPAEVPGRWTNRWRFVLLPSSVSLVLEPAGADSKTGRGLIRWAGGSPGLLYRLQFFGPGSSEPGFTALTVRPEYLLPPASPWGRADVRVRVTALSPDGAVRGVSPEEAIPGNAFLRVAEREFLFAQAAPTLKKTVPGDGETVATAAPVIEAEWDRAVAKENVLLFIDGTDITQVAQIAPGAVRCETLLALSPGPHTVMLSLDGKSTSWTFTVPADVAPAQPDQAAAAGAAATAPPEGSPSQPGAAEAAPPPPPAEPADRVEFVFTALGTISVTAPQDQPTVTQGRLQVTGQVDAVGGNGATFGKATADLVGRHDFSEPYNTVNESRNWLIKGGAQQGGKFKEEATVGYAAPAFLDQAMILTSGLSRGQVTGRVETPFGAGSYYRSWDARPAGTLAGNFGPEQFVQAAAYEIPGDPNKFFLRLIGMKTEDQPGTNSAGGNGELWGLFGRYSFSQALAVVFEGGRGSFTPNLGSAESKSIGNSFRLGLQGLLGTFSYTVNALHTDPNFVNPANRGFTAGGVSDRTGGDLSLSKTLGTLNVSAQYRHIEGGNSSQSTLPKAQENGGGLTLAMPVTPKVNVSLQGNITVNTGDADAAHAAPATDRTQKGVNLTVSEMLGTFNFTQNVALQKLSDAINPLSDQDVKTASLAGSGPIITNFLTLSANVSGTQSEGPSSGRTDQYLVSLQPAITIQRVFLTLTPRGAYTRSKNDVSSSVSDNEQYQVLLQWSPPWVNSLLSLQVAADWTRSKTNMQEEAPPYQRRIAATLTIRWGANYKPGAQGTQAAAVPPFMPLQPGALPSLLPVAGAGFNPGAPSASPLGVRGGP